MDAGKTDCNSTVQLKDQNKQLCLAKRRIDWTCDYVDVNNLDNIVDFGPGYGYDCENWSDISLVFDPHGYVNEYANFYQHGCDYDCEYAF